MKGRVCLDLDGVLARSGPWQGIDHIGEPILGSVEFTYELSEFAYIIIHTTRCTEYPPGTQAPPGAVDIDRRPSSELARIVADWLDLYGYTYDEIHTGQGKPYASAYIDDRAVVCRPQDSHHPQFEYQHALASIATLCSEQEAYSLKHQYVSGCCGG